MSTQHSPGQWWIVGADLDGPHADHPNADNLWIHDANSEVVAMVETSLADSLLIAAAPSLLFALIRALPCLDGVEDELARAAIASATTGGRAGILDKQEED